MEKYEIRRQRYVNLFVLLSKNEDLDTIINILNSVCQERPCKYTIRKSFLDNFIYIRIYCDDFPLSELRNRIYFELSKYSNVISWFKTETIEVR